MFQKISGNFSISFVEFHLQWKRTVRRVYIHQQIQKLLSIFKWHKMKYGLLSREKSYNTICPHWICCHVNLWMAHSSIFLKWEFRFLFGLLITLAVLTTCSSIHSTNVFIFLHRIFTGTQHIHTLIGDTRLMKTKRRLACADSFRCFKKSSSTISHTRWQFKRNLMSLFVMELSSDYDAAGFVVAVVYILYSKWLLVTVE